MPPLQKLTGPAAKGISVKSGILVIDDMPDQLQLQKTILEVNNYEVFTAVGGRVALEILREITPQLILLDVQMQDMSGPEFLDELEATQPEIFNRVPIVFLTATDTIPAGKVTGLIRKPLDITAFLSDVQRYIEKGNLRVT